MISNHSDIQLLNLGVLVI